MITVSKEDYLKAILEAEAEGENVISATLAQLELPDIDGVYLVGVHLRGRTDPNGPDQTVGRGRIFLPFADDDPKTAEVMAKVLLLARDDEIKDPTILEQIRA